MTFNEYEKTKEFKKYKKEWLEDQMKKYIIQELNTEFQEFKGEETAVEYKKKMDSLLEKKKDLDEYIKEYEINNPENKQDLEKLEKLAIEMDAVETQRKGVEKRATDLEKNKEEIQKKIDTVQIYIDWESAKYPKNYETIKKLKAELDTLLRNQQQLFNQGDDRLELIEIKETILKEIIEKEQLSKDAEKLFIMLKDRADVVKLIKDVEKELAGFETEVMNLMSTQNMFRSGVVDIQKMISQL